MCGKRLKLITDLYKLSKVDLDPDHILLPLADHFVKDTPAAHVPTLISGPTSFQIWLCEDKHFWSSWPNLELVAGLLGLIKPTANGDMGYIRSNHIHVI